MNEPTYTFGWYCDITAWRLYPGLLEKHNGELRFHWSYGGKCSRVFTIERVYESFFAPTVEEAIKLAKICAHTHEQYAGDMRSEVRYLKGLASQ